MALLTESDLTGKAGDQVQQSAEVAKYQKQADQDARQLLADCVRTLEEHGTRQKMDWGFGRFVAYGLYAPGALLSRTTPAQLIDIMSLSSIVNLDGKRSRVTLSSKANPHRSPDLAIYQQGLNCRLVLNRHLGYGEIYLNNPRMNEVAQRQGRATIDDVAGFRNTVSSIREFVKADPVPWPKDIEKYSQMNDEELGRELKGANRWSCVNTEMGWLVMIGSLAGMSLGFLSGHPEGVLGGTGVIIGGGSTSLVVGTRLSRKIQIIQDEIASRS